MTNYIVSIGYKKSFQKKHKNGEFSKPIFLLISNSVSRQEFVDYVKDVNEYLDLRTAKTVDEIPTSPQGIQFLDGLTELV